MEKNIISKLKKNNGNPGKLFVTSMWKLTLGYRQNSASTLN
jgi:hypothetical protein